MYPESEFLDGWHKGQAHAKEARLPTILDSESVAAEGQATAKSEGTDREAIREEEHGGPREWGVPSDTRVAGKAPTRRGGGAKTYICYGAGVSARW